jgi:hypothetical protein
MPVKMVKGKETKSVAVEGKVETQSTKAPPNEETVPLGSVVVEKASPMVGVKLGMTKNLGNYESFRADVSLYMPVQEGESLDKVFTQVKDWVDKKMEQVIGEIAG